MLLSLSEAKLSLVRVYAEQSEWTERCGSAAKHRVVLSQRTVRHMAGHEREASEGCGMLLSLSEA